MYWNRRISVYFSFFYCTIIWANFRVVLNRLDRFLVYLNKHSSLVFVSMSKRVEDRRLWKVVFEVVFGCMCNVQRTQSSNKTLDC